MVKSSSNQRLEIFDKTLKCDYRTTYLDSSKLAHTAKQGPALPRINKNASEKEAIINPAGYPASFKSTSRAEFRPEASALSAVYEREKPAFDRVSSCKTNYSLGSAPFETRTTNAHMYLHPDKRAPARQPEIGGWKRADGSYKADNFAIVSLRRGGGGGEGALGVRFNIVTGEATPGVREARFATAGARKTLNMTGEKLSEHYNVATNRHADPGHIPGRDTPGRLRRPDAIILRTRPW